ncbi:hypothetical protein DFH29DRAFT_427066 [Suillus ampliporus]|nr:hypothetical protein DFH29DRAFT_427066 [Suillus ampliporus]
MISIAVNSVARVTIIGYLSASYFKEVVIDSTYQLIKTEKASLGVAASNFCVSTIILVLASDKAARTFLRDDINKEPAPTQHHFVQPNLSLAANISTPSASSSSTVIATETCGASPITSHSIPIPHTLPSQTERLKRLSLDSDTTVVAPDDDDFVKDVSDNPSDTKDREGCGSESVLREDDCSGNLVPGTKTPSLDESDGSSSEELRPPILDDELQRTLTDPGLPIPVDGLQRTSTDPGLSLPGSAYATDVSTERMTTLSLDNTPILSSIPRLKPPDTTRKRTANGILPHPPTALRHQRARLGKQKYDRAFRLIAARDSIAHYHMKQDTAIIDDLEQLYDEILVEKAARVDGWVAAMAGLGLTSVLSPQPSLPNQQATIAVASTSILPQG